MLIDNSELLNFNILPTYCIDNWEEKTTFEYTEYKIYKSSLYSIIFNIKKKHFMLEIEDSTISSFIKYYMNLSKNQKVIKDFDLLLKKIAYQLAIKRL